MDFSQGELTKIEEERIFIKKVGNAQYWVKPLFEYKNYPLGSIKSHKKYFQMLKKYLNKHIPETRFIKFRKGITLIVQKHIFGKRVETLGEIERLIKLKQNRSFGNGLKKLLETKGWVIDMYVYKENFIATKTKELFYIDGRMPVFSNSNEERYGISKKRTLQLLRRISH